MARNKNINKVIIDAAKAQQKRIKELEDIIVEISVSNTDDYLDKVEELAQEILINRNK